MGERVDDGLGEADFQRRREGGTSVTSKRGEEEEEEEEDAIKTTSLIHIKAGHSHLQRWCLIQHGAVCSLTRVYPPVACLAIGGKWRDSVGEGSARCGSRGDGSGWKGTQIAAFSLQQIANMPCSNCVVGPTPEQLCFIPWVCSMGEHFCTLLLPTGERSLHAALSQSRCIFCPVRLLQCCCSQYHCCLLSQACHLLPPRKRWPITMENSSFQ